MNRITRLAAAAATTALTVALAAPAGAATTVVTDGAAGHPAPVVVKWQTLVNATINLFVNYNLTGTGQTAAGTGTILQAPAAPTGGGACATTSGATTGNTLDYGGITPDSAAPIACYYEKAIDAIVSTNSSGGWNLTEALSAALPAAPAGWHLCAYSAPPAAGGVPASAFTASATAPAAYTAPTAANVPTGCTVAANKVIDLGTAASANLMAAGVTATGQGFVTEDVALVVPANATAATGTTNIQYTLTAN